MGIYQAFFPITAGLLLISLIKKCLCEKNSEKLLLKRAFAYLGYLVMSLGLYFMITQFLLLVFHRTPIVYRGARMGEIDIVAIPGIIFRMYRNMLGMLSADYKGMSADIAIRILIGISWLGVLLFVLSKVFRYIRTKQWMRAGLSVFFVAIFPIAINLIDIMCAELDDYIYILMEYALCLIFILPIVLWETSAKSIVHWCMLLIGGMVIFYYVNLANEQYILAELSQRSVESFYTTVVTQIKSQNGYRDDMEVIFVGWVEDPTLYPIGDEFSNLNLGSDMDTVSRVNQKPVNLLKYYCGFYPEYADEYDEQAKEIVEQMPCYPNEGSIRIVGEQVIVKFSNEN